MRGIVLAILVLALLMQTIMQTVALKQSESVLNARLQSQAEALREVALVRQQLHSILTQTKSMAEQGNANAVQLVDALTRQGVQFVD